MMQITVLLVLYWSSTASYADVRQVATLAEGLFELDRERTDEENVLAAANRIQNEQERAKLDSSSDDFLE